MKRILTGASYHSSKTPKPNWSCFGGEERGLQNGSVSLERQLTQTKSAYGGGKLLMFASGH